MISILCYSDVLLVMLLVPKSLHRNLTEWDLWNREREGWKVVAFSPVSSMLLEAWGKEGERDIYWVWEAECQSCWKQLLILIVLCQSCEYRPRGWHGSGVRSSSGSWHQPPWSIEKQTGILPHVTPVPHSGKLDAKQQERSCAASLSLAYSPWGF